MALAAIPIVPWRTLGGNGAHPETRRLLENAAETFLQGTPVWVDSTGYLAASPTISSALTIAGFSQQEAHNRTSDGVVEHTTEGTVVNQPSAQVIPGGARPDDGRIGVWVATSQVVWIGAFYNDTALETPAQADVGQIYGLTKQSNGFWAVDKNITAAASGAICEIVDLPVISGNPQAPATPVPGSLVAFKITQAARQLDI